MERIRNICRNIINHNSHYNKPVCAIMTLCSFISSQTLSAQTDSLKSIKLDTDFRKNFNEQKNRNELKLNEDAIKLIKFDFMPSLEEEINKPMEAPLEKSWMKFKQDLDVPVSLTDTTRVRKPDGYIRMLPYTIWTRFGEDPVYDVMVFGNKKKYEVSMTINPLNSYYENYGLSIAPSAGVISDGMRVRGAGIAIGGLDIIGFLYSNFSKQGRTLRHNRIHANAWRNYIGYQPTLSDSLKFPTFYNGLEGPVFNYNPQNSMHIASPVPSFEELPDSVRKEIEMVISVKRDSLRKEYLEKANEEADEDRKAKHVKRSFRKEVKEARKARKLKEQKDLQKEKEEKMIEDLSGSMDDLYKYMREKNAKEAEEREKKRKEKELEIKQE